MKDMDDEIIDLSAGLESVRLLPPGGGSPVDSTEEDGGDGDGDDDEGEDDE